MKINDCFRNIMGKEVKIIEIKGHEATCLIMNGMYKGGVTILDLSELRRYTKIED